MKTLLLTSLLLFTVTGFADAVETAYPSESGSYPPESDSAPEDTTESGYERESPVDSSNSPEGTVKPTYLRCLIKNNPEEKYAQIVGFQLHPQSGTFTPKIIHQINGKFHVRTWTNPLAVFLPIGNPHNISARQDPLTEQDIHELKSLFMALQEQGICPMVKK